MTTSTAQFMFYNNPDGYPPIINSTQYLAKTGWSISMLCRETGEPRIINYPLEVKIDRTNAKYGGSFRQYLR